MNQDILLSKIVPNATETTWSQAYTTLNVYITVSIETAQTTNSVASVGKDVLEKLQREFFALDDKSLENIKKAVENVVKGIEPEFEYSIIVGAIVKDVLYIVIASRGYVILKRGEQVGIIAEGKKDELVGFSGRLEHDDIVSFETGGFDDKIPLSTMEEYLSVNDVTQISENITPLVHGDSKGTEAAIILQYKNMENQTSQSHEDEFVIEDKETVEDAPPKSAKEELVKEDETNANLWTKPPKDPNEIEEEGPIEEMAHESVEGDQKPKKSLFPTFNFGVLLSFLSFKNKRGLIILTAIVLVIILVGSIAFETNRRAANERKTEFAKLYDPAKSTYEEGVALESLNKSLALEKLIEAQKIVESNLSKFPENSQEYKDLASLLAQIEGKIESIGGGGQVKNPTTLTKASNDISSINAVTFKGGEIVIVSQEDKKIATIKSNGDINKSFDSEISGKLLSADEKYVYILGSGVERIDKGNGNQDTILDEAEGSAIDIFGSNFYILDGTTVNKYRAPSDTAASYFTDKPTFESTPISFTIDGDVWILEENGNIAKFTKGKSVAFEVKGLLAPFSENSLIYTDADYSNLYILDSKNQRVVAISKNGDYQNQYEWSEFENANSFAIDEVGKKGYITVNNTLMSFDL